MKPWDELVYDKVAVWRSAFFRPLALILVKLGLKPDAISYTGLVLSSLFIYVIGRSLTAAFWLIVAVLILDQLDGAMARYSKTASNRGKFVDVIIDSTTSALIITGIAHAGFIGAATAGIYIYLAALSRVLAAIRKNVEFKRTGWLFYAGAGPLPNAFVYLTYVLFGWTVFFGHDWLQASSVIFAAILGLKSAIDFLNTRYQKV